MAISWNPDSTIGLGQYKSNQTDAVGGKDSITANNSASGIKSIAANPGTTVSGEIVEVSGKDITIRLDNNQTVSAKLDGNVSLTPGQIMSFEVRSGQNDAVELRPLMANLSADSAAVKALTAAGLSVNETNLAFTNEMMKEGMSVNRNALLAMQRSVTSFPSASPADVVALTKLGMPISETNLTQFANYRNFEHQIILDVTNVANGLADIVKESADSGNRDWSAVSAVLDLIDDIQTAKLDDYIETINVADNSNMLEEYAVSPNQASSLKQVNADGVINMVSQSLSESGVEEAVSELNSTSNQMGDATAGIKENDSSVAKALAELMKFQSDGSDNVLSGEQSGEVEKYEEGTVLKDSEVNKQISLSKDEQQQLFNDVKELAGRAGIKLAGELPLKSSEILKTVKSILDYVNTDTNAHSAGIAEGGKDVKESLSRLLSSKGFSKLLSDSIKSQFTLTPKDIAKDGAVEELYERINRQSARITELMESINRTDSSVAKSAANISDNVQFMNQLNEFANYVQLPLKMYQQDAHGDLYVYTNKKSLGKKDGNLSALLHLDMEHLGPMDVHVSMNNFTKVNTHFYIQSEELMDFIEQNIHLLEKRLNDKGYDMKMSVTKKDSASTPIAEEFLKDDSGIVNKSLSKLSFDVRA